MAYTVRKADYFQARVADQPGEAYRFLAQLAELGVNLLAFTAVPVGPAHTQLTLFPDDAPRLRSEATRAKLPIDGPYAAFLVQGDDELGALAGVHVRLQEARVNVFASTGVTDGKGSFGYVIYVKPEDFDKAAHALRD